MRKRLTTLLTGSVIVFLTDNPAFQVAGDRIAKFSGHVGRHVLRNEVVLKIRVGKSTICVRTKIYFIRRVFQKKKRKVMFNLHLSDDWSDVRALQGLLPHQAGERGPESPSSPARPGLLVLLQVRLVLGLLLQFTDALTTRRIKWELIIIIIYIYIGKCLSVCL